MRVVNVFCVLIMFGVLATAAMADPSAPPDLKPWSYDFDPRATIYEDEPLNDTCPGQPMECGDLLDNAFLNPGDQDWFEFYGLAGQTVTIGTDSYGGSTTDTYLELYAVCGGAIIAQDDDGGPGLFSLISGFPLPADGYYKIKVRGYSSSSSGAYIMFLECGGVVTPPENDRCDGAIAIPRCESGTIAGDLTLALNDYDPSIPGPSCTGYSAAGPDVTYVMDLLAGDQVHLFYYGGYDESFYIVTDCADMTTCVAGADATVGTGETIDWTATADGTYYVIVDKYGASGAGAWTMTYTITCPGPPTGACCVGQECFVVTADECTAMGGVYVGGSCTPNPCAVPVEESTWGSIKSNYR